jgi:hypothetical protein
MFGYIRPYKSELLVREYEQYKAVYCQLCRELGESFGRTARFTLSYDCTFYAMLILSVTEASVKLQKARCRVNPLKQCSYLPSESEAYRKAAALSLIMTEQKLRDNLQDESFAKSLGSRLLLPFIARKGRKACRMYPFLGEVVAQAMEEQKQAEQENAGIDRCADPTAKMLSKLFGEIGGCDPALRLPLEELGYYLGRWVYLMDAADDLADDCREGSFNPFIQRLHLEGKKELSPEDQKQADEACNQVLNTTVARILPACRLLPQSIFTPILENILEKGLGEMQREILFLHVKRKKREKEKV